ncbi:hypothetical protein MB02_14120 [Croceicoccus estronivorus]|uniref:PilZ domain-containing protein n=1 Tax=Croceicoccus estronivorus TaxID=1172626 RepID=UPI00082A65CF|nr:PilZ domain-containing protein [Croceicoccus estronivorus]OCC22902.1 hypothetical protein MB02_14120 [Croceicoccus estronivorus]
MYRRLPGEEPRPAHSSVVATAEEIRNDGRRDQRVTLVLRTAKLIADRAEFLCLVRDVSATGVKLQLFHALPPAKSLFLEMDDGEKYQIEHIWTNGDFAGFRFPLKINLHRMIANPERKFPRRQLRLRVPLQGFMRFNSSEAPIEFENISQQGARIKCDRLLAIEQRVTLDVEKFPPIVAKIRWRERPFYGLVFEQTFRYEELANRLFPDGIERSETRSV